MEAKVFLFCSVLRLILSGERGEKRIIPVLLVLFSRSSFTSRLGDICLSRVEWNSLDVVLFVILDLIGVH